MLAANRAGCAEAYWQPHTCGTRMHLEHNVPVAIISAWLGHADTAFTMRTYVHHQPDNLAPAAESISSWTRGNKSAQ